MARTAPPETNQVHVNRRAVIALLLAIPACAWWLATTIFYNSDENQITNLLIPVVFITWAGSLIFAHLIIHSRFHARTWALTIAIAVLVVDYLQPLLLGLIIVTLLLAPSGTSYY